MPMVGKIKQPPHQDGFTMVELMIVVAIIGILAAIALPAFVRYIQKSKTSEALTNVRKIYDGQVAYYNDDHSLRSGTAIAKQFVTTSATPATIPPGLKVVADWSAQPWESIQFAPSGAVYYRYLAVATGTGSASAFTARAEGDLDNDTVTSLFERTATAPAGEVLGSPAIYMLRPIE